MPLNATSEEITTYRDVHKTHGDIRGAAYDLVCALKGSKHYDRAVELHDSVCKALTGPMDFPVTGSLAELRLTRLKMIADAAKDGASLTWIKAVANEGLLDEPLASLPEGRS
jgi:hypothetical protein